VHGLNYYGTGEGLVGCSCEYGDKTFGFHSVRKISWLDGEQSAFSRGTSALS